MDKHLLKESDTLHRDAIALLHKHQLKEKLGRLGEVLFTGSFVANLMTAGDIDVYVMGRWNKSSVRKVFENLLDETDAKSWQLFNWVKYRDARFPKAWYIKISDVYRNRKWKIDIWFLTESQVRKFAFARWKNIPISEKQRAIILAFKKLRDQKRWDIPSHRIYEAVLKHDAITQKRIREYCLRFKR